MRGYNTENNTNKHFPEKIQHLFLCTSWTLRPIISPKGTPPPPQRCDQIGLGRLDTFGTALNQKAPGIAIKSL